MATKPKSHVLTVNFSPQSESDKFLWEKLNHENLKSAKLKYFANIGVLISEQLKKQGIDIVLNQEELKIGIYQDLNISKLLIDGAVDISNNEKKKYKKVIS